MALGRSIRIYLDGGEVSGLRHAELVNWTGQALLCPRNRVAELARWEAAVRRPGVYFLIGAENITRRDVYVGEAEVAVSRIKQHLTGQEFWQEVVIFTSKDENLTKAHIKYLEARIIQLAKAAGRYRLDQNEAVPVVLPRADRDAMEEYLNNARLLLGALGHRILDPVVDQPTGGDYRSVQLFYSVRGASATGTIADDGFVVFKGSTALAQVHESIRQSGYLALKEGLIKDGKLMKRGDLLKFTSDVLFSSASAAAAVVYGNAANGRVCWKTQDGKTLKELEEEQAGRISSGSMSDLSQED
ncbi:GIY-YIG nuclease family protein [Sorangium sp. So ce204]|uniref:GIY-YIG nuclease family protein n=1 Tax=Sorangium sp. So ce204 TaxID=3133288 RepID=UPI003F5D9CC3